MLKDSINKERFIMLIVHCVLKLFCDCIGTMMGRNRFRFVEERARVAVEKKQAIAGAKKDCFDWR